MYAAIAAPLLPRWQNFYVMVGSAAAALIGLQFVVIALTSQMRLRNTSAGIDAFSTPTIVYFSTVLMVAAVLCAPWSGLAGAAMLIALCGGAGTVYAGLVTRRALSQTVYRLVLEDWLWHILFPLLALGLLFGAGLALPGRPVEALFTIAGAVVLLLFIGIHNAWDAVTYMVIQRAQRRRPGEAPAAEPAASRADEVPPAAPPA